MPRQFDAALLEERLRELPSRARAAFALACALRLASRASTSHALAARARELLSASISIPVAIVDAEPVLRDLEASPELDQDDVAASFYALSSLARDDPKAALWAAQRAYESADAAAQDTMAFSSFSREIEESLLGHPLVQHELSCQARDLEYLKAHPDQPLPAFSHAGET